MSLVCFRMLSCLPAVTACSSLESPDHDCLVLVCPDVTKAAPAVSAAVSALAAVDSAALTSVSVCPVALPCRRLVFSPTGPLDRDYDDVRRFSDAANAGMKRALAAGAKKPLLMVEGSLPGQKGEEAALAGLLGALAALYVPLEIRDLGEAKSTKVTGLGWAGAQGIIDEALAIETGRVVCRDIGGSITLYVCMRFKSGSDLL